MKKELFEGMDIDYSKFSKSFKKIMNYINSNKNKIAYISINELADATETSTATVNRFTKKIGFTGYIDFQKVFQKKIEEQSSKMKNLKNTLEDAPNDNIFKEVIDTNISLLKEMDYELIEAKLNEVIQLINNSNKVYVLGARGSYSLAHYLYFILKEFREGVELMVNDASDFTDKLLHSKKDDLLFVISFHPYTNFTCQVAEFFKENGNKIITITDKEDAILGEISDLVITTKNSGKAHSLIPCISIINALLLKLGVTNKEEVINKLDRLKTITDKFHIYNY